MVGKLRLEIHTGFDRTLLSEVIQVLGGDAGFRVELKLLAPGLIARVLVGKYVLGVPFARQESLYRIQGESIDRATSCLVSTRRRT
jgi:hypothetical protein